MKIAIWKTGHEIADTVADALKEGLNGRIHYTDEIKDIERIHRECDECGCLMCQYDIHIGYGILRGASEIFRLCDSVKKAWINVDRGYFQPGHYNGHYRLSLCGTQQTIGLDKLEPDYERFAKLGIEFPEPYRINADAHTLVIPPTDYAARFFGIDNWQIPEFSDSPCIIRKKGDVTPLGDHLTNCLRVVTFNSSIGWEALKRGIPVYSDPDHSIIGAYQKLRKTDDTSLHLDIKARRELFAIMSGLQMTLEEIRSGKICTLMEKLLSLFPSSLAGIPGNQSPATLPPIP